MLKFPEIDPVIFRIGPLAVRWYGLMYLLGFAGSYLLVRFKLNKERGILGAKQLEDLYFIMILGLVVGARVGYMVFYNTAELMRNPLSLFLVWQGGMSFHGGLIGVITAAAWFSRKQGVSFLDLTDMVVVTAPIGLALGRLGNFINGELWGRPTTVPWAVVFPNAGLHGRHPSQLYELGLEGILLFVLLWTLRKRFARTGQMSALFLMLYGLFRSMAEFFREPDAQLGFLFGLVTMGQLLSCIMVGAGAYIFFSTGRRSP